MQKISSETKTAIRLDWDSGIKNKAAIARRYAISYSSVEYIIYPEKVKIHQQNRVVTTEQNTRWVRAYNKRKKSRI